MLKFDFFSYLVMSWPMDNTMKIVKNTVRIPLKPHSSSYALCLWYPYACAQQFWGLYVEFWANGGMKCVFPGLRRERPFRGENWQKNRNKFRPVDQTGPAWKKLVVSCKGDHVIAHTNLGVCMSPTSKNIFFAIEDFLGNNTGHGEFSFIDESFLFFIVLSPHLFSYF